MTTVGRDFEGWIPAQVRWRNGRALLRWLRLGRLGFTDPFFDGAIGRALADARASVEHRDTSFDELADAFPHEEGSEPSGFVFHLSRCGSTLVAQLLSRLTGATMICEAPPIDAVPRAHLHNRAVTDEQRIRWLRAMVSAMQRSGMGERHLFVKFDAWNTLELPLILRAFPSVPWIFACREPAEVLHSHMRMPGSHMVSGVLEPAIFGWSEPHPYRSPTDYGAAVLGAICDAARSALQRDGNGRVVDYASLPAAVWSNLPALFGITPTPEEIDRMKQAGRYDAKNPAEAFRRLNPDPAQPLRLVDEHLQKSYLQLLEFQ